MLRWLLKLITAMAGASKGIALGQKISKRAVCVIQAATEATVQVTTTQVKRTPMTHTRTESEDTKEAEVSAAVTIGSNAPPTDSKVINGTENRTAKIW